MTITTFDIGPACIGGRLGEGTCERLERQLEAGQFRHIDEAGYPPADFQLNRGDWFLVEDLYEALDGRCYLRQQEVYTGVAYPSKEPVYFEVELIDEDKVYQD